MSLPPQHETRLSSTRVLKACDACKARKLRCSGSPAPCVRCATRKTTCHFGRMQLPRRQKVATQLLVIDPPKPNVPNHSSRALTVDDEKVHLQEIHVDRLLANARKGVDSQDKPFSFKGNGLFLTSASYGLISFFSDSRLLSLSTRLRSNKLQDLVLRISQVLQSRSKPTETVSTGSLTRKRENLESFTDTSAASKWIQIYFQRIHPIYPFLDREMFEATTKETGFHDMLKANRAWSALYHCVLALGCQHDGGGSFEPGSGQTWRLFSTSLALYPDMLGLPDSLITAQALTAMAIYSSGISCLSIEHLIISEAARRIQRLARNSMSGTTANLTHRTFWVLYSMEKVSSFYTGRTSPFVDHDISCPIPLVPEAVFGDFDWFLTYARHSRLLSRALSSLFSSGVTGNPPEYYPNTINQLNTELEAWRLSIPAESRPGQTFRARSLHDMLQGDPTRKVILWTHYLYSGVRIMLARALLQLAASVDGLVPSSQQAECKNLVMEESRAILELTMYIEAEPWTPLWILVGVPIIALFTLFELVIFNPKHHGTRGNLALLDIAGGYFSRLEYASQGSLPASLVSEFAYIAREYVNNFQKSEAAGVHPNIQCRGSLQLPTPSVVKLPATTADVQQQAASVMETSVSTTMPSLISTDHGPPMMNGTEMMGVDADSCSPMSMEGLYFPQFPMGEELFGMNNDFLLGTDVMDLFSYSIPTTEPFFAPAFDGQDGDQIGQ